MNTEPFVVSKFRELQTLCDDLELILLADYTQFKVIKGEKAIKSHNSIEVIELFLEGYSKCYCCWYK